MKKITKIKLTLTVLCIGIALSSTYAQLPLVSDQQIDFSNAVSTVSSGNWSNPSIWSNGVVPTATTDVIIQDNHTVYIDVQGASSGDIVDICRNINIKASAVLRMGHNTPNFAKDLRINGSILCNGTFSAGRNQPGNSGDGSIYNSNSRIYLRLLQNDTFISGSGFFNPLSLNISSPVANRNLIIDHYNILIDRNFEIKSNNRINATVTYYSYMHVKQSLGLTGSTFQFSSATAKADLTIEGVVVADNVSLFTKNPTPGESSSITIADKGSLYVQSINEGDLNVTSEAGGFNLNIENEGLFRLGEGIDFNNLIQGNSNFTYNNNGELREHYSNTSMTKAQITAAIDVNDPNLGVDVSQIQDIFGASHIAGWYNFTNRPYLLEGLDYYQNFGATSIKTTLTAINGKMFSAYPFNHTWPNFQTIKQVAQHELVDSLFQRTHIKTHTFWTTTKNKGDWKEGPDFLHDSYMNEEQQFYDLTRHLLQTYGSMDKTFVYQNWEGDWMLRGQGVLWEENPSLIPDNLDWDIEGMARLFRARQRGTERARNEFPDAVAKVYHGIEFNKLWWNDNGTRKTMMDSNTPCVIADVVSKARIDLSSWSAYDASWSNSANPHGHAMWRGLQMARYFTTETGAIPFSFPVQIGEFAINENPPYNFSNTESVIRNRYGRYIGVALGLDIPNFYLWNLYCSGQQGGPDGFEWEKGVQYETSFLYDWMDGKWMLEPDGSWGHAANFLMEQWMNTLSDDELLVENSIKLFPNPAYDTIEISNLNDNAVITLIDLNGRVLKQFNYLPDSRMKLGQIDKGTYLFNIKVNEKLNITKKLIIN
jgi:hypothetical protein